MEKDNVNRIVIKKIKYLLNKIINNLREIWILQEVVDQINNNQEELLMKWQIRISAHQNKIKLGVQNFNKKNIKLVQAIKK